MTTEPEEEEEPKPTDAWGYIRVSSERQVKSGLSLESQTTRIMDYCKFKSFNLKQIFTDPAQSGTKIFTDRPGARDLMASIQDGDAMVSVRFDRLFRRAVEGLRMRDVWIQRGIQIHILDFAGAAIDLATPMGKYLLTIMLAGAELEWELNRMRVIEAREAKIAKYGAWSPRRQQPPGFKYEWQNQKQKWEMVPDEEQQLFMAKLWEWYHVKGMSFDKIRQHLEYTLRIPNKWANQRGPSGKYGEWTLSTVRTFVREYEKLMQAHDQLTTGDANG